MPAPAVLFVISNIVIPIGPIIAPAIVGGIMIKGFLIIFATCNIDVPTPKAINPPIPFSLYIIESKLIILAEHPIAAAPAANPFIDNIKAIVTLGIGAVNDQPIITSTSTPNIIGL